MAGVVRAGICHRVRQKIYWQLLKKGRAVFAASGTGKVVDRLMLPGARWFSPWTETDDGQLVHQ